MQRKRTLASSKRHYGAKYRREAFMTAASPGVIALFLENKYYDSHGKYSGSFSQHNEG